MSTDIVALEKQYAKLRRKQHHACVVISGIKPARAEMDVDSDNPGSPGRPLVPEEESNHVENSVAMLTLSVPLEVEKSNQDLTDPISPTIFGDTKCFFVQNLKKKTKDKHHQKHPKRQSKTNVHQEKASSGEDRNDSTTYHKVNGEKSNKRNKKVCFKDDADSVNDKKMTDEASGEGVPDTEETSDNGDCNMINESNEKTSETHIDHTKEDDTLEKETCKENGLRENMHAETKIDAESDNIDSGESRSGITSDDHPLDKVEAIDNTDCVVNDSVHKDTTNDKEQGLEKVKDDGSTESTSQLDSYNVKPSRTQVITNPSVKFSKQYYPSNHVSHKKHRTKSESVENTNKQSIYQHFNLTKRQLSLDSALSGGNNKATQAKILDFPFPVHSINEHKIKAGVKLGLYDQKALEKLEKTRKIPKTKLPNLTFD